MKFDLLDLFDVDVEYEELDIRLLIECALKLDQKQQQCTLISHVICNMFTGTHTRLRAPLERLGTLLTRIILLVCSYDVFD